jgi:hypothetical protein
VREVQNLVKNMCSVVPGVPGHQGQSGVSRFFQRWSRCGVVILSCNILHAMSPSLLSIGG